MLRKLLLLVLIAGVALVGWKSSRYDYSESEPAQFPTIGGFYYLEGTYRKIAAVIDTDDQGIRVTDYGPGVGKQYNPVSIAATIMALIGDLDAPGAVAFIDNHLRFLISYAETTDNNNLVYPYHFDWLVRNERAPWYSAMAQGKCASALLWGYRITGKKEYLDAAKRSILALAEADNAYGFRKELADGIWLKEYPHSDVSVLDGSLTTIAGIYDLYRTENDPQIKKLLDAALNGFKSRAHLYRSSLVGHYFADDGTLPSKSYHRNNLALLAYLSEYDPDLVPIAESFHTHNFYRLRAAIGAVKMAVQKRLSF